MEIPLTLRSTVSRMANGVATVAGVGQKYIITIGGTWAVGDYATLLFTDQFTGVQTEVGYGNVTGKTAKFCFTFNDKVYVLAASTVYFSALASPTVFNDPNGVGNGFIILTNHYATSEDLTAIASFQGRLAFFSRQGVQIWQTPADPASWSLQQIFEFIGTRSPKSVKTVGDFEVFFLDETGFRSLRVRDNTLNAFSEDLGSPIDEIVQAALVTSSDAQKDDACGIVDPSSKRYWCFLKDTIYVFSNFPSSKVAAWSRYSPTYSLFGIQTAFVPEKFVVYKGQVFLRAGTNSIFLYGGSDGNTYDNCVASWETPWLDAKTPGHRKESKSIDVAMTGSWKLEVGMDPVSGILTEAYNGTQSSYDMGTVPYSDRGTHFKIKGSTTGATAAKVGMLLLKYEQGDEV